MDYGNDQDTLEFDPVNHAIAVDKPFADCSIANFLHGLAKFGVFGNGFSRSYNA